MPRKRHKPEEIVAKLRQVDVSVAQGRPLAEAIRGISVSEVTYHRWRNEYGGLKLDQVKRLKELEQENTRLRKAVSDLTLDKLILQEGLRGKLVSPERRRATVREVCAELGVSERRACRVLGQPRSTQRRVLRTAEDEQRLTAEIVALAVQYGRYGYPLAGRRLLANAVRRRVTALLRQAGWVVNAKRVERIWRREGLKVPRKQPKKGRLWLNDGSCLRLRPERANHVWAYDFVEERTHDGRKFRMLCVVDEFTREVLAILVKRRLNSADVLEVLAELMLARGTPSHIRSDNGPEFAAVAVKEWLGNLGVNTAFIEPGSPWENGYVESFNSKLRDELLDGEIFYSLKEAAPRANDPLDRFLILGSLIEAWRRHYNAVRPHSALGWQPPAPEVSITPAALWPRPGPSIAMATNATVH
ncbi:MAG: IS3 family transposase [Pseudomonadota bacterium]